MVQPSQETPEEARARRKANKEAAFAPGGVTAPKGPTDRGHRPQYLPAGLVTAAGQPGDRFVTMTIPQMRGSFANESKGYDLPRTETPRAMTLLPSYGRIPVPEDRHPRTITEYFHEPIPWMDRLFWLIDPEQNKLVQVYIHHPENQAGIPRSRWWAWFAKYGPGYRVRTHEGRVAVRRDYPFFASRDDYDYSLISDPFHPSIEELYWVLNPEIKGMPLAEINRRRELELEWRRAGKAPGRHLDRRFTDWRSWNTSEQGMILRYYELLILGGALEDPRNFNPWHTQVDYHMNRRHGMVANPTRTLEADPTGAPIYEWTEGYYTPVQLELTSPTGIVSGQPLFNEGELDRIQHERESLYGPLIGSRQEAEELYEQNKGYSRNDFDPRPQKYRDLGGNYWPERDEAHGIVSDSERMAETFLPSRREILGGQGRAPSPSWAKRLFNTLLHRPVEDPEARSMVYLESWIIGPSHSASDTDIPAEGHVLEGKYESHIKINSHEERLFNLGIVKLSYMESDTSNWWLGWLGGMAKRGLKDAKYFLKYYEWWDGFEDLIHQFVNCQVRWQDFEAILKKAPPPGDFWRMVERWEYFKYDPAGSHWGYKADGTPKLPQNQLERLVLDPSEGGLNMQTSFDGKRVLQVYREQPEVMDKIFDFWLQKVPADQRAEKWRQLELDYGLDYLTMGYCFWRPMEKAGDLEHGLLYQLWRCQPKGPFEQRLKQHIEEAELNRITNVLEVVVDDTEGFPCELHGRPDVEKVIGRYRREAFEWWFKRQAEFYWREFAHYMNPSEPWASGIGCRIGDDLQSEQLTRNGGVWFWKAKVFDNFIGRGEVWDDFPAQLPGDEKAFRHGAFQARSSSYYYYYRRPVPGDQMTAHARRLDITDWLVTWSGLPNPSPGDWTNPQLLRKVLRFGGGPKEYKSVAMKIAEKIRIVETKNYWEGPDGIAQEIRKALRDNPKKVSHPITGTDTTVPWTDEEIELCVQRAAYCFFPLRGLSIPDDVDVLRGLKKDPRIP